VFESVKVAVAIAIALSFCTSFTSSLAAEIQGVETENSEHPYQWTHRPLLEHFTGLSCPPCMSVAHPDATRLWEEEGYIEGNPWNYIEFHELNGGGEDDLMTDESRDRMKYYQPGVSGTPSLDADGGYVEMGGSHSANAPSANYEEMKSALQDSGERDQIKMVNLKVASIYDGQRFSVRVDIEYIENNENFDPMSMELPDDTLNGRLHIFMVEDHVTAWSTVNDADVTMHNVFREYALEGKDFELQPGESLNEIYADWLVPSTIVRDGIEEPIRVPINPRNVYPVAVVFDMDDTSSGRGDGSGNEDGGDGNDGSPRALNSATPEGTAYDEEASPPSIELEKPTSEDGKVKINAVIEDDGGELTAALVIYREASHISNVSYNWSYKPMTINGEVCDGDICTIGSGESFAVLNVDDSTEVEYSIVAYDGNWTKGSTDVATVSAMTPEEKKGLPVLLIIGGVILTACVSGFIFWARKPSVATD